SSLGIVGQVHAFERSHLAAVADAETRQLGREVLLEHLAHLRHPGLDGLLVLVRKRRLRCAVGLAHFTTTTSPLWICSLSSSATTSNAFSTASTVEKRLPANAWLGRHPQVVSGGGGGTTRSRSAAST